MSIRVYLAPLMLALAAGGCSAATIPNAEPGSSVPAPAPSSATPTGLTAIQACDLLTPEEVTSLGMRPHGRPESVVGLRRCDWSIPGGDGVSTAIDEEGGIDDFNFADASSVTEATIGRHTAKRAVETSGPGYCGVHFAVGGTASVSVTALYLNDTSRACAAADQAAAFVEPKLP
ncbi:MAG: DUF3558 family protein [Pseudonocardiaceae bacterium]